MIYKRLMLIAICLGAMYFPCKGENSKKKNVEKWYIVSRHSDYMPLKTLFIKYKELKGASTPQELLDKLKKNGDDAELVDIFANLKDKEKFKKLNIKFYKLTSKSKGLALILTNKNTGKVKSNKQESTK
ncbi:MAG: hypothetical protein KOO69_06575 [Victivallales bacterium]|nr:hypothetical protein [Victivallales bacterium]